ncbi:MAG: heme exporter protein CcmB [Candidatus Muproteobacteria bacterium RBG_16_65_34]|uniref:Heme exporter protein B n=1 Tax=Candidatus Muproteobacteria bacterium RBG_16_65_34 TaxID=1817760 RepID=A0A1F6TRD7_9PROT|nr:MAG: heme exporter protein CcmB [Candidatus Muproteobacteria bacterium RBG_16_65_34]
MTSPSLLAATANVLRRDLTVAWRRSADVLTPLVFFAIVTSLFPLGVGPEPSLLRTLAPGVLWVAALLSVMLALNRMFANDYADGTLELLALSPHPLSLLVLSKVAAHWVLTGLPLVLISPLLAVQLNLPSEAMGALLLSLLLGTPVLSLIGAVGAALTLGLRGGGVLVSLLVLPLYTPVLIFGAGSVAQAAAGAEIEAYISLLAAFLALTLTFAPWAAAAALRVSLD